MSGIAWMQWGSEAFERAKREDRPILLSISAVWCHWCHVMDETTYSDPAVIDTINASYVPIRVDNDERPDVNARYNMGGWPTTAFLTPDGMTLTGATYLPPDQMLRALGDMLRFYAAQKSEITARAAEIRAARIDYVNTPREQLKAAMVDRLTKGILDNYDEQYAGFGDAPKFPQPELLDFLLAEWRASEDAYPYQVVAHTVAEMSQGGMYDHVEGGFFRYSTTRDWSVPHFEKMTEDHAGLVRVLCKLHYRVPSAHTKATLEKTLAYVRTVLRDNATQLFAGSQDADEEYFALPLDERHKREAPFVDRRSYSNWTSAMAASFAFAWLALGDETYAREAEATLDALDGFRDADGLLYHVVEPNRAARITGLLTDQVAYIRALLDAHEILGTKRFYERAIAHANLVMEKFSAADGGFYDSAHADKLGRLEIPDRPIHDNGLMAENLLRLHAMTRHDPYVEAAEGVLTLYARSFERAGSFAATYARSLRRYLSPEISVRITGDAEGTAAFRVAARRLPSPFTVAYTEPGPEQAAYVCVGTACAAPVTDPPAIAEAYASLAAPPETPRELERS